MTDFFEWLAEQERSNPELYQSWLNAQLADGQDQDPESLYNKWLSYKSQPETVPQPEAIPQKPDDNTLDLGAIPPTVQTTQPSIIDGVPDAKVDIRPNRVWNQNELLGNSIQPITQKPNVAYYNSGIDPNAGQRADEQKQEEFEKQQAAKAAFETQQKPNIAPESDVTPEADVAPETVPQPEAIPTKVSRRVYPVNIPAANVDSRVYSLDNINKLNPKAAEKAAKQIERNQKLSDKEAAKAERAAQKEAERNNRIYAKEAAKAERAAQKEAAKAERAEQKKAAKANRKWTIPIGDTADAINSGINAAGNAVAASLTEGQVGLDPSGTSAMLRQQADDQMKQAAEMNMFKQQQLQDANVSPEQRAEQYAAGSAAAKHAQQSAQSKPGEYVDTVVENPDIAQQQQMQQQYRQQAQELSKDANQYLNAARQRTMDAQEVDNIYNENRRVNNRIYQLTGGMGIKGNDGKYQIIGGSRDNNNAAVSQPEATPTSTPTQPKATPKPTPAQSEVTAEAVPASQPEAAPKPAPVQTPQSSGVNNVNFVDESIKQREATKQQTAQKTAASTPTPSPTINPNGTASTNAATASQQYAANTTGEGVPTYIIGLWKWYNAARQVPDGNLAKLGAKKSAEIQSKLDEARKICSANIKPGLQQFNLGDYSYDNCMKIYQYVEPYVRVNKGDK